MTEREVDPTVAFARDFEHAFQRIYLHLHRRDGKRSGLSGSTRGVLVHLAHAGPLTVGELADHLDRAQSVVSDVVSQMVRNGLLEREPDPADRRRHLVWLSENGLRTLDEQSRVLSLDLIAAAAAPMTAQERAALLSGMRALLAAGHHPDEQSTHHPKDGEVP